MERRKEKIIDDNSNKHLTTLLFFSVRSFIMNVQEDENVCFSSIVVIFHPLTAQRDFSIHSFIFIREFCFFIAISSMSTMMTTMVYGNFGKCRV